MTKFRRLQTLQRLPHFGLDLTKVLGYSIDPGIKIRNIRIIYGERKDHVLI